MLRIAETGIFSQVLQDPDTRQVGSPWAGSKVEELQQPSSLSWELSYPAEKDSFLSTSFWLGKLLLSSGAPMRQLPALQRRWRSLQCPMDSMEPNWRTGKHSNPNCPESGKILDS